MTDEKLEWDYLRVVCGWVPYGDPSVAASFKVDSDQRTRALKALAEFQAFTDPRADILFAQGVEARGISNALAFIEDPQVAYAAMSLYSRLKSLDLYLRAPPAEPDYPDMPREPAGQDEEIESWLLRMGVDPATTSISLDELKNQVKARFESLDQATANG
jgi:hypothetical protein